MNQILVTNYKNKRKFLKFYITLFIISIIIILFSIFFKFSLYYGQLKYDKISKDVKNFYNLEKIYSQNNSNTYQTIRLSNEISIIGVIHIPKINLEYPIIAECTDNLLKISICKLSGPNPNNIGNLNLVRS